MELVLHGSDGIDRLQDSTETVLIQNLPLPRPVGLAETGHLNLDLLDSLGERGVGANNGSGPGDPLVVGVGPCQRAGLVDEEKHPDRRALVGGASSGQSRGLGAGDTGKERKPDQGGRDHREKAAPHS